MSARDADSRENTGLDEADIAALRDRGEAEDWTFSLGLNGATDRTLEQLCGFVDPHYEKYDPALHGKGLVPEQPSPKALPDSFDWRTDVGTVPIRDQGACGSCWAFATIGLLESLIRISDGTEEDLSEQWLVSCNSNNWGCGGGYWAHDYLEWKEDNCGQIGAVREHLFPYRADEREDNCPYERSYLISSWDRVSGRYPSVGEIKEAILNYGPIAAAVYVDPAFQAYTGGVFNSPANGAVNHGIILVGWDDSLGEEGAWILRNSWGIEWGERGYMYIEYGRGDVGYDANYVTYAGADFTGTDYTLKVTISPPGAGIAWATPPGWRYAAGTTVTLHELPNPGWSRLTTNGDLIPRVDPIPVGDSRRGTVFMDGDKEVQFTYLQESGGSVDSVEIASAVSDSCGTIRVPVNAKGASNIQAFSINLKYNNQHFDLTKVELGAACIDWGFVSLDYSSLLIPLPGGGYEFTQEIVGSIIDGTPLNGDGEIAILTLECKECPSISPWIDVSLSGVLEGANVVAGSVTCGQ